MPDAPLAPVTTAVASDVTIDWQAPKDNGSPLTSYRVYLRASTGSYIEETTYCTNTISRQCTMPLIDLISEPYSLSLGDSVYAKIIAVNAYGQGIFSSAGNGATCVLVPSPPL